MQRTMNNTKLSDNTTPTKNACITTKSTCDYSEVDAPTNMKVCQHQLDSPGKSSMFEIVSIVGQDFTETTGKAHLHGMREFPLADLSNLHIDSLHERIQVQELVTTDEPFQVGKEEKVWWSNVRGVGWVG